MEVERIQFDKIESTHMWAVEHIAELNKRMLTCITADDQTGGIGRKGNAWVSKPGNLAMTLAFALPPHGHPETLAQALTTSARHAMGFGQYKWPNDLLIDGKKVGGAMVHVSDGMALASIGLNVNTPITTDQPAIALCEVTGKPWNLQELIEKILAHFQGILPHILKEGFAYLHREYESNLAYLNEEILFKLEKSEIRGILKGLSARGELIIQIDNETTKSYTSGELRKP